MHFNGVEKELPQGTNGSYGTSLIYGTALNPANDILIAYKHNGKLLAPDHGFPVRMIIPGGIGGRMVKWLANIEVLATESDNFYHQHDNKVLPAGIEMDQANAEGACFLLLLHSFWIFFKSRHLIQHSELLKLELTAEPYRSLIFWLLRTVEFLARISSMCTCQQHALPATNLHGGCILHSKILSVALLCRLVVQVRLCVERAECSVSGDGTCP